MIYTPMTYRAMNLAYRAHHGQVDRGGAPYIFHPFHLAEQMTDEYAVCVALLHDVAEDTAVTIADLAREFPPEIVEAVGLMTHAEGVDYFEYVRAIRENPLARAVKLADLHHNMTTERLPPEERMTESAMKRRAKYEKARAILLGED